MNFAICVCYQQNNYKHNVIQSTVNKKIDNDILQTHFIYTHRQKFLSSIDREKKYQLC